MTSLCKSDALWTRWSPPLNRRKLHPKHRFKRSRQKSGLPSKTNTGFILQCSYCGLLVCNMWRRFTLQFKEKWGGLILLNHCLCSKMQPCFDSQEGKHLDSTWTEENFIVQLQSSAACRQTCYQQTVAHSLLLCYALNKNREVYPLTPYGTVL